MATSEWIQFFKDAGIPPGPAVNYAVTFVDNRIQKNMLLDLNKEIMNELGITLVGDVIAILKHAKIVYRQEMCKAATESLNPNSTAGQSDLRRTSAASRMIANSLSRDSPTVAPLRARPHAAKISVTVSNKMAASKTEENPTLPVKRRRVTAEMEGKYVINMPKGTTPRTKKILEQQAAKGLQRTSVFDRLGAEAKADTTTGGKPTGVFSRLGDTLETDGDKATESDDDCSVLQYAGVLKNLTKPLRKESAEPGRTMATSNVGSTTSVGSRNVGSRSVGSTSIESGSVGSRRVGSTSVESTTIGSTTVGSTSVGSRSVGSTSVGLRRVGSTSAGLRRVGSTRVGSTSVESTSVGSTSVGSTSVGSTSVGSMTIKLNATSSEAKLVTIPTSTQRFPHRNIHPARKPRPITPQTGIIGISAQSGEAPDDAVTTTKEKNPPAFRIMIKRTWGCEKISSTSEIPGARMDNAGTVSVFKRLGKKPA